MLTSLGQIRTIVARDGVPAGTPGDVVGLSEDRQSVFINVGAEEPLKYQANEIEPMSVEASHGEVERTLALSNSEYAGTGLPEELLQVQHHIRELRDAGYSYLFMEKHLMSMRFAAYMIRRAFKKLTGLDPEQAVNFNYLLSPGSIPQFNLGWGEAKKGKGYFFLMPIGTWYSLLHQENDITRNEVGRFNELKDAVDALKGTVKKAMRWDPPVKEVKDQIIDVTQLYRQPQIFMHAHSALVSQLENIPSWYKRKELIDQKYLSSQIERDVHKQFLKTFCDIEEEAKREFLEKTVDDMKRSPGLDEIERKSENTSLPVEVSKFITQFIASKNEQIRGFKIVLGDYTYRKLGELPKMNIQQVEPGITSATAIIKVELNINPVEDPVNVKHAISMIVIVGDEIRPSDGIRDIETHKEFPLTQDGLKNYFSGLIPE